MFQFLFTIYMDIIHPLNDTVVVQGVEVAVVHDIAVVVSWNSIQDYPVDFYTVVYSPVSQRRRRQDGGEMSAVFPPPATSGVIGGLDPDTDYQFQVFATVTVDGVTLEGERSTPATGKEYTHIPTLSHSVLSIVYTWGSIVVSLHMCC